MVSHVPFGDIPWFPHIINLKGTIWFKLILTSSNIVSGTVGLLAESVMQGIVHSSFLPDFKDPNDLRCFEPFFYNKKVRSSIFLHKLH